MLNMGTDFRNREAVTTWLIMTEFEYSANATRLGEERLSYKAHFSRTAALLKM
jgi:hypothetical protein